MVSNKFKQKWTHEIMNLNNINNKFHENEVIIVKAEK